MKSRNATMLEGMFLHYVWCVSVCSGINFYSYKLCQSYVVLAHLFQINSNKCLDIYFKTACEILTKAFVTSD